MSSGRNSKDNGILRIRLKVFRVEPFTPLTKMSLLEKSS